MTFSKPEMHDSLDASASGQTAREEVRGAEGPASPSESVAACQSPSSDEEARIPGEEMLIEYTSESEIRHPLRLLRHVAQDIVAGRELAWRLFVRNLRGLYRQTLLGLFWAFLPPIANTAVWIFLQSQNVFKMGDTGVPTPVYILTGMILWQAFIDAFQAPATILRSNQNMLAKLRFPRESLLMVACGETLFNLGIRLLLLIPAFWWFGIPASVGWLVAPLTILGLVLLGMSLGVLLMPIGSLYQDIGRFITMIVPFWMIITPIIYVPPTEFPGTLLNWVNPAAPLLIVSRDLLLLGATQHASLGWIFGLATVPLTIIGLIWYRISMPVLIERMTA